MAVRRVDRIVAGTDFPQGMAVMQPVDFVEAIPGLTHEERTMIQIRPSNERGYAHHGNESQCCQSPSSHFTLQVHSHLDPS